jgi:peptide-methionine (S)-S-oxide reductase
MKVTSIAPVLVPLIAATALLPSSCRGGDFSSGETNVTDSARRSTDSNVPSPTSDDVLAQAPASGIQPQAGTDGQASSDETQVATFGAGCFWCVEAVFLEVDGVLAVESGYSGGRIANPTYRQICTGTTGHAEVCQIRFNPKRVSFDELLEVFWQTHDPTTLNRQGNDVGTQYRSVIFYHNDRQREVAEKRKQQLNEARAWPNPVVTEISPLTNYYKAEAYHQNYYRTNPRQGYCQFVIRPKLEKFRKVFKDKLRKP